MSASANSSNRSLAFGGQVLYMYQNVKNTKKNLTSEVFK